MPAKARGRCAALLLLLIPAIAATGSPSLATFSTSTASSTSPDNVTSEVNLFSGSDGLHASSSAHLARIGREILGPPSETSSREAGAKSRSLPGVPAGIFMVLVGFLCVSFVNDRRLWLASLAGLLWLGQTGVTAIPEAASSILAGKTAQKPRPNCGIGADHGHRYDRLRSDLEGTKHIALLRHLAGIPTLISSSMPTSVASLGTLRYFCCLCESSAASAHLGESAECGIVGDASNIADQSVCSACAAEHCVLFSPGFVFHNLARGPPHFDWN